MSRSPRPGVRTHADGSVPDMPGEFTHDTLSRGQPREAAERPRGCALARSSPPRPVDTDARPGRLRQASIELSSCLGVMLRALRLYKGKTMSRERFRPIVFSIRLSD